MTEIHAAFPELDSMDLMELQRLEVEITASANGDWQSLDDVSLAKLWRVMIAIRRKAAHSNSARKSNGAKKTKTPRIDSDDLL